MEHKLEALDRIRQYDDTIFEGRDALEVQVAMVHALLHVGEQLEEIVKMLGEGLPGPQVG